MSQPYTTNSRMLNEFFYYHKMVHSYVVDGNSVKERKTDKNVVNK
jgi:hypothetical protein